MELLIIGFLSYATIGVCFLIGVLNSERAEETRRKALAKEEEEEVKFCVPIATPIVIAAAMSASKAAKAMQNRKRDPYEWRLAQQECLDEQQRNDILRAMQNNKYYFP